MKIKFNAILERIKVVDYRNYISVVLLLIPIVLGATIYINSYIRFGETFIDFINSFVFYFKFLFGSQSNIDKVTILNSSEVTYPLEIAFEEFVDVLNQFSILFIDKENFKEYFSLLLKILEWLWAYPCNKDF